MLGLCFSNLVYVATSYSKAYFAAIRFTFRFYSLAIASLICAAISSLLIEPDSKSKLS